MHRKRKHEKVKKEVCHMCGNSFFDKSDLKEHVKLTHSEGEQFVCDKCGTTYAALKALNNHVRKKNTIYYLCAFCDKKMFRQHKQLRVHLINEHDVKCGAKDFYVCWKC